jgi:glutathione S-transferase
MILYEHPLSPYARKVKIALYEKGLPFERRSLKQPDFVGDDFTSKSPRREVPVLVDGDLTIVDSTIICEYLEDLHPEPKLYPSSAAERARVRMLEEVADTQLEAILWGMYEIRFFNRASGELADRLIAAGTSGIEHHFDWLEGELEGREFFNGDAFGIADISLVPHLGGAAFFGVKAGPSRPRLARWVKEVRARASVQEDESHLRGYLQNAAAEVAEAAGRPRQYRDHRLEWMVKSGGLSIVIDGIEKQNIQFSAEAARR